jgi:phosphate acyltransferase
MNDIHVAVDAMGGDAAPRVPVEGACLAARTLGAHVTLVGKADLINAELARLGEAVPQDKIAILDTPEWIEMGESPASALRTKKRASLMLAADLVAKGAAQVMVSAGNSGAAMGAAVLRMGTIKGVERPAIALLLPTYKGETIFLDGGATVDCSAKNLLQFGRMGAAFARSRFHTDTPRVGLLSIGEEATKGNSLVREAHELLKTSDLNFVGNVEPKEMLQGVADVVVCDGFVGNIALKIIEAFAEFSFSLVAENGDSTDAALNQEIRKRLGKAKQRLDWAEYGGALLLGVKGLCIISHGRSTTPALAKAIEVGVKAAENQVISSLG